MISNILQIMCPHTERVATNGLAVEVVARVLDDEADIVVPSEVNCELDVPDRCSFHNI